MSLRSSYLGHDWNGYCGLNFANHLRVTHSGDTSVESNVGGDAFKGHHSNGASCLGDFCLLDVDDVHDDTTLQHSGQTGLDNEGCFDVGCTHLD